MSQTVTQPTLAIRTKSEPLATKYTVMFDRDIEESNSFHEEFYVMEQATQNDVVDVCISSFGGSVATISKFQDVVKNSPANFHGKLHGYGYSAGGALFLLCHTQEVSDLATFMAHSIQTGYSGGTQAIEAHSKMSSKQNEALCRLLYEDFLTEDEIVRVIDGAEIWMEANEIRERLSNRDLTREKRLIEESKETYTPEFYARSVYADMLEDCDQFDYSLDEILEMVKGYSDEFSEDDEPTKPQVEVDCDGIALREFGEGVYYLVIAEDGIISDNESDSWTSFVDEIDAWATVDLKAYADVLDVKYTHNMKRETLAKRLDEKVKEIVDSMKEEK